MHQKKSNTQARFACIFLIIESFIPEIYLGETRTKTSIRYAREKDKTNCEYENTL